MCSGKIIPAKTLCRIFAFLNLFLGLLSLYYWELMSSFTDKITFATRWDSLLPLHDDVQKIITIKCGKDYLTNVKPREFGSLFKRSIQFYIAACVLFSIKGFLQFFVTCFDPILARAFALGLIVGDLFTTCLILYGLYLFRSPQLCLLEHTEVFYYPNQQSHMTIATLACLGIFKFTELFSLFCFICDQNKLISVGEIRSKGVRRSEAFRTPMTSRVNSYLQDSGGGPAAAGYFCLDKNNNNAALMKAQDGAMSSDDDLLQEEVDEDCLKLYAGAGDDEFTVKDFVEIDLNDNDNNNGVHDCDDEDYPVQCSTATVIYVHNNNRNTKQTADPSSSINPKDSCSPDEDDNTK